MLGKQMPLAVQLRDAASFETFFAGPNAEAVAALRADAGAMLIFGPPRSGRTHLLQALARARGGAYLPLADFAGEDAAVLDGYPPAAALCLDDLGSVCSRIDWCLALVRLLDSRRAAPAPLLLAAEAGPERLPIALPDLRTRLQACAIFGLKPLDDAQRRQLLRERARLRGLDMPEDVARWLTHNLPRDAGSLLDALEALDRASLSAKRRLTLPFAQSVLAR